MITSVFLLSTNFIAIKSFDLYATSDVVVYIANLFIWHLKEERHKSDFWLNVQIANKKSPKHNCLRLSYNMFNPIISEEHF